jgi:formylmethanofuran dehydrogenase subunit E
MRLGAATKDQSSKMVSALRCAHCKQPLDEHEVHETEAGDVCGDCYYEQLSKLIEEEKHG